VFILIELLQIQNIVLHLSNNQSLINHSNNMATLQQYATIELIGTKSYAVIDSANQVRLVTTSEIKAKNFLAKLLKQAGINN